MIKCCYLDALQAMCCCWRSWWCIGQQPKVKWAQGSTCYSVLSISSDEKYEDSLHTACYNFALFPHSFKKVVAFPPSLKKICNNTHCAQCLKIIKKVAFNIAPLRAKRATFTFWVDKSSLKMPKMVHFDETSVKQFFFFSVSRFFHKAVCCSCFSTLHSTSISNFMHFFPPKQCIDCLDIQWLMNFCSTTNSKLLQQFLSHSVIMTFVRVIWMSFMTHSKIQTPRL